jgi:hypothetical protein
MRNECPKCRFSLQTPAEACPACGVIFSKMANPTPRPMHAAGGFVTRDNFAARCQACGQNAPTALAHFRQNVGMLFLRREKHVEGNLCRACCGKYFWQLTLTTIAVGWLGMISLVIAPIYVILNITAYVRSLGELAKA